MATDELDIHELRKLAPTHADASKAIACANCGHEESSAQLYVQQAYCPRCDTLLCIFCGCTEERGCVDPGSGLTCGWGAAFGVCDFCEQKIAEEAYRLTNERVAPHELARQAYAAQHGGAA